MKSFIGFLYICIGFFSLVGGTIWLAVDGHAGFAIPLGLFFVWTALGFAGVVKIPTIANFAVTIKK